MESEIRALLEAQSDEVSRICAVRSAPERKDGLNRLLRDVLRESSLCYVDGELSAFNGRAYEPVGMNDVRDAVVNVLSDMGVGASDLGRMGDTAFCELRRKTRVPDMGVIAFRNCLLKVKDMCTYPFSHDCVPYLELDYDFDGNAQCPKWLAFLEEILPDEEMRDVLQEFFGMCFMDRSAMSIEKMAMFVGSGANGKSVVCDVIREVMGGNGHVGNLSPDQLQDQKQVTGLVGRLLNIAPDVRRGAAFDSALKALASSQEITGWKLYAGGVTVKCPPLAFALNEMPYFKDTTNAFFRRLLVFRFDIVIPEDRQNRRLASQIVESERCGVFRWIMEGRRRLMLNKGMFSHCDAMDIALAELRSDVRLGQSQVLQKLEENGYSTTPQYSGQQTTRVMAAMVATALNGYTRNQITREMKKAGVEIGRGGDGLYYQLYEI